MTTPHRGNLPPTEFEVECFETARDMWAAQYEQVDITQAVPEIDKIMKGILRCKSPLLSQEGAASLSDVAKIDVIEFQDTDILGLYFSSDMPADWLTKVEKYGLQPLKTVARFAGRVVLEIGKPWVPVQFR